MHQSSLARREEVNSLSPLKLSKRRVLKDLCINFFNHMLVKCGSQIGPPDP